MRMMKLFETSRAVAGALALLLVGCTAQAPAATRPAQESGASTSAAAPVRKVLTLAISTPPSAFGLMAPNSFPSGGWSQITELHSDGLITAAPNSRDRIGRLSENVPTLDDGTISMLPDGKMRLLFHLRKGVTWQDGAPFTSQDMILAYKLGGPGGIPSGFNEPMRRFDSVEAPDDSTLVVTYKAPYFMAIDLGPHAFWPLPRHILGAAYDRYVESKSLDEIMVMPYWSSEYVHLGPFRLTSFDPGQRLTFEAYDRYFLGRPKIDVIQLQVIGDQNTILSNLLAGTVQVAPASSLVAEAGAEAKRLWDASGQGKVHVKDSSLRLFEPQHNPAYQMEQTALDPRVRKAIMHALDRAEMAGVLNGSRESVAWSILGEDEKLYAGAKDGLREYVYDPARARALLVDVGWRAAVDGSLRHSSDGRPFRTQVLGTPGRDEEMHINASYIRALGIDVEENMVPPARFNDRETRAQFPGWATTGGSLTKMMSDRGAGPQTNWIGNQNGYDNPAARRLVDALETTIVEREQLAATKAISDFVAAELPALPIFFLVQYTAAHKSVKAFDDMAGSDGSERQYGGYTRNAYLWDLQ
jgi:peptide/nickel transport system substrate-binding protein